MPGSPNQNGVVERRNRTLMDIVMSMCSNSKLPESLWTEALNTTGCPSEVRVYNPQEKKLDPRTISAYFIGYSERSKRLIVIHNIPQVQLGDRKPIIEVSQIADHNPVDQVVQDWPDIVEQPVEQHDPQENVDTTLRRSTRARKTTIPSDYVVYLQESDYTTLELKMILKRFYKP
ncbi:hypothetical protein CK203_060335 [Vitis vinifera]|uniref:Retrovirus-related Pol polyprotein from transposon TNT 1-94 n=1 Tax=Vitis vinifera TaxID=29760 RepID=A0A438FRZ2_VITVI|nr:hypothetical protein CK203_060335 [Vitis vinifera]